MTIRRWLTPSFPPSGLVCKRLEIPAHPAFIAAVFGALWELTKESNWEQVNPEGLTISDAAALAKDMMLLYWDEGTMPCDCITDITYDPVTGKLMYTQGGETFEVLDTGEIDLTLNFYQTPPPDPDKTNQQLACAIAENFTAWWFDSYQDSLDQAEAAVDSIAAADAIMAMFPPAYVVWDATSDAVNEWVEAGIGVARALDTVEVRADFLEALYCLIAANGYAMDMTVWHALEDEHIASMNALFQIYNFFVDDAMVDRALKSSYGDTEGCSYGCDSCFSRVLDYTLSAEEACSYPRRVTSGCWKDVDWAEYVPGVGYRSVALTNSPIGCGSYRRVHLITDLGADRNITNVRYVWSKPSGTVQQEEIFSAPAANPQSWTSRYQGNEIAGEKSFSASITARYILVILEMGVPYGQQLPAGEWVLEELEVTAT